VDTCRAQRLAGRKSLVFVRQTGERDIQERLAELLQNASLRVEILRRRLHQTSASTGSGSAPDRLISC